MVLVRHVFDEGLGVVSCCRVERTKVVYDMLDQTDAEKRPRCRCHVAVWTMWALNKNIQVLMYRLEGFQIDVSTVCACNW